MLKQICKNIAIIFLTVSAIYLTGQLWFTEMSGRDFTYVLSSFFPTNRVNIESERRGALSTPFRIITGREDNVYTIIHSNLSTNAQKKTADAIILKVLSDGSFSSSFPLDYSDLLNGSVYIYEYAVSLPSDAFARSFGLRSGIISGRVRAFDKIALKQSSFDRSFLSVIFVDIANSECHEFLLRDAALSSDFNSSFSSISENGDTGQISYISSVQSGYEMFSTNVFIPIWEGDIFLYNRAIPENPYLSGGMLHLNTIESKVDVFFDKPASKWVGMQNEVFTYSEGNTVVKYFPNNVLEYSYYGTILQRIPPSFEADYYVALNFIDRDIEVTSEYYLAQYEQNATQSIFYFNFVANDFPVTLSNIIASDTGMSHPIEVTVESGIVRRYRKMAANFSSETEIQDYASLKFDEYIARVPSGIFDDISIGYNFDRSSSLMLFWFLSADGITDSLPTRESQADRD